MARKCFFFLLIFLLIFSFKTFSWWSAVLLRESTHHKLTSKAIEQLNEIEYPDIYRFKDKICNWTSGPSDDENAHGKKYDSTAGKYNGGPYEWWWDGRPIHPNDGMLVQYNGRNFVSGTKLYPSTDQYYCFYDTASKISYGSVIFTQSQLQDWKSTNGVCYWLENGNKKYIGDAFDSSWGRYGGDSAKDIYDEEKDNQDVIQTQFLQSVAYLAGFLRTASEKLPPLVSGLALTSNTILQNSSTAIKFQIDENRLPNVKVSLAVDNKPIKAADIVWDSAEKILQPNDKDEQLPYQCQFSIDWDGKLADETYPADGRHELVVQVQDADGNWSDSCGVSFVVDRSPPKDGITYPVKAAPRVTAFSKNQEVILRWINPDEPGGNAWIYRTEDGSNQNPGGGNFIEKRSILNNKEDSFSDKGLINGITYTYTLYIENQAGSFSLPVIVDAVPQELVSNLDELLKDLIYEVEFGKFL